MLLQSQFSDIVTRLIVVVLLNIAFRYLSHIAQYMGCVWIGIFSHASLLNIEARKTEHLFLEYREVLVRQLTHKELLRISGIARILGTVLDGFHALVKLLPCNSQGIAEVQGIESSFQLFHHNHDVIGRLVIHHHLAVTVVNGSTGRELNLLQKGITISILLIVVAHNLKRKQTNGVNDHNSYGHSPNNKSTLFKIVIYHTPYLIYYFLKPSMAMTITIVITVLPPIHMSHCIQLKKLNVSSVKNKRL